MLFSHLLLTKPLWMDVDLVGTILVFAFFGYFFFFLVLLQFLLQLFVSSPRTACYFLHMVLQSHGHHFISKLKKVTIHKKEQHIELCILIFVIRKLSKLLWNIKCYVFELNAQYESSNIGISALKWIFLKLSIIKFSFNLRSFLGKLAIVQGAVTYIRNYFQFFFHRIFLIKDMILTQNS